MHNKKNAQITAHFTHDDQQAILALASEEGVTASEWIRNLVTTHLEQERCASGGGCVMSKLSMTDCFVLGALAAITNNNGIPVIISQKELCSITGLKAIQISMSLRKLHTAQLLVVIWFGNDAHIRVNELFPELLEFSFRPKEEAA